MTESALLPILMKLERELHVAATRSNPERLRELLHPEFIEFGRSGKTGNFTQMFTQLQQEHQLAVVHSQEFSVRLLAEGIALLTYKSAHIGQGGKMEQHTLRSSLWKHTPSGWQVLFHQGTPTQAFAQNAP
jgi:hypothetical protein